MKNDSSSPCVNLSRVNSRFQLSASFAVKAHIPEGGGDGSGDEGGGDDMKLKLHSKLVQAKQQVGDWQVGGGLVVWVGWVSG